MESPNLDSPRVNDPIIGYTIITDLVDWVPTHNNTDYLRGSVGTYTGLCGSENKRGVYCCKSVLVRLTHRKGNGSVCLGGGGQGCVFMEIITVGCCLPTRVGREEHQTDSGRLRSVVLLTQGVVICVWGPLSTSVLQISVFLIFLCFNICVWNPVRGVVDV